jgi:GNAT superfamily N-acetyltransferase
MPEESVTIRRATLEDSAASGQICYDAFSTINREHGFPCDLPSVEAAKGMLAMAFAAPGFYCVVAERNGLIAGSNCMDERSAIHGIGPITVAPAGQNGGVGRSLMEAVMQRAEENGAAGMRLVQAAFHNRSLSLYTRLRFDIREPLSCLQGRTVQRAVDGCAVRAAAPDDLEKCNALARGLHGFDRSIEVADAIARGAASVVLRDGRITAYATGLAFFCHAVAETNADLQALIASAESLGGPGILVPSRNTVLLRWCLENGLRVVQPMTLMSKGLYNEPAGAWLPSIFF